MALKSSDLYRVRALEIVKRKVLQNQSHKEIASAMGIHVDTVERSLVWARKANIFKKLEDQMWQEMVPKAMKRVLKELDNPDGDVKTAEKVLYSIGLLQKAATRQQTVAAQEEEESLAAIVHASRASDLQAEHDKANTLEGELVAGADISAGDLDRIAGYLESGDVAAGGAAGDDHPPATAASDQEPS